MKKSQASTAVTAALGMLLLILDSKTALSGAQEGLSLCLRTVIPSLFPFFILSTLLTGSLLGTGIPLLRPIGRFLGIPKGSESILAAGFLGGYPVGAQAVGAAVRHGQLTPKDAKRMLAFCNNAGPAFLFGMAASLFPFRWMAWALWGIHILSALLVAAFLPGKSTQSVAPVDGKPPTVTDAMRRSLRVMAQVCGWVVLFRVIIAFLSRWFGWLLPATGQVILSGILELSNGCCALADLENTGLRFVICSGFLAFGGLCVTLQTVSVSEGVDRRLYFPGKLLQTAFSLVLSSLVQLLLPPEMRWNVPIVIPMALLTITIFPLFHIKIRNKSGNPIAIGV